MIGDAYQLTMRQGPDGIVWDLQAIYANGGSCRVENGTAFTWQAAAHQAGNALDRRHKGNRDG